MGERRRERELCMSRRQGAWGEDGGEGGDGDTYLQD